MKTYNVIMRLHSGSGYSVKVEARNWYDTYVKAVYEASRNGFDASSSLAINELKV